MHFATIFAAATAALASTASALPAAKGAQQAKAVANVLVIDGTDTRTQTKTPVEIPFGKLTHFDKRVTSLELTGVTVKVEGSQAPDISRVRCRRYRDEYGLKLGSWEFKKGYNADISTTGVDFGWVLCWITD
ncbi:hypothetical protein FDECE_8136 [Fusarium decemcellulare]|nr:hypothetical protein FDECE_8136 [Fusarium decemcellulare]